MRARAPRGVRRRSVAAFTVLERLPRHRFNRAVHRLRAGVTQLAECQLPKLNVEGSNPFTRSTPAAAAWRYSHSDRPFHAA